MGQPRVLLMSNGAGEDSIAARIAQHLHHLDVAAFPLVGNGGAYTGLAPVVGPSRILPSGGLIPEGVANLWRDLRGGLLGLTWQQLRWLRAHRCEFALLVCVGDLWSVGMGVLSGIRPLLFIGTAKSDYHHAYSWPEVAVLRTFAVRSLVRDEPTARHLRRQGVAAAWVGNAMMDGLEPSGLDLDLTPVDVAISMFPGSRQGTYTALPRMLEAYRALLGQLNAAEPHPHALVCLAPSVEVERLAAACPGYRLETTGAERGVIARLHWEGEDTTGSHHPPVKLVSRALADALSRSQIGFGVAGTAHEEAAGCGVPVVSYAPEGEKNLGWYRGRQKGLLGDALSVVKDDIACISAELLRLLRNPEERLHRGHIGRERLGPAGGSRGMARAIERMATGELLDGAGLQSCRELI